MNTEMHKGEQMSAGVRAADWFPPSECKEEEAKTNAEKARWTRYIRQEALHNACNTGRPLVREGKEAPLKQVSEQATRQAQEELDRAILCQLTWLMLGSYANERL
jgi:hypothetical protein